MRRLNAAQMTSPNRRGEDGSTLVMFMGVAATLAILAAGLVMVVMNTQASTHREATRTKAFDVAEAALDVEMQDLAKAWPTAASPNQTKFSDASYRQAFRSTFDPAEFPDPAIAGASFVTVRRYDDQSSNAYDGDQTGNPNGRLIVDAQAVVGKGTARIRAVVEAVYYPLPVDKNKAGAADGGFASGGPTGAIMILGWPPNGAPLPLGFGCGTGPHGDPDLTVAEITFDSTKREEILSDAAVEGLVRLAKDTNRYFGTDQPHVSLHDGQPHVYANASSAWAAAGQDFNWQGLIVIDAPGPGTRLDLGNAQYNTEQQPGLLLVLDRKSSAGDNPQPAELEFTGNTTYVGLIYGQGTVHMNTGTTEIIGMLLTGGQIDARGTANLRYHYGVLSNLSRQWLTNTRLTPGGWRELKPDPTRAPAP